MKLINIQNQAATINITSFDCFRLARVCELLGDSKSAVDVEFAEVYAAMFAAIGMAAELEIDAPVKHGPRSLEYMRAMYGPEDVRQAAD